MTAVLALKLTLVPLLIYLVTLAGRRWGPRVLDLDIILWSGGAVVTRRLNVPHPELARRAFVLGPLAEIAPDWPVAGTGRAVRHLAHRIGR